MTSPAVLADLAPTGKLRIAIMYTNPVLASGNPNDGTLKGIASDLAHELSKRLNVPLQIVGYETSKLRWAAMETGAWDFSFSSYDPKRKGVMFTPTYMESDGIYLVLPGSPITAIAEVDRAGVRIAVSEKSALDLHLTRSLQKAQLVRIPGAKAAAGLVMEGKADVLAGVKQQILRIAAEFTGSRILEGRFMTIAQAFAIPTGHKAGYDYLSAFVEDIKASGLAAQLIEKNGITGMSVSPRAQPQ